jgi:hypothetical protein
MNNKLTKKEQLAVEFLLQGHNQTESVFRAFDCKNRNVARALAPRIFKKEKVSRELAIRRALIQDKLTDKLVKFVELVERYAPRDEIAKKLAENIMSSDRRVSDSAIDKYIKLRGEYFEPTTKIVGLFERIGELERPEEPEAGAEQKEDLGVIEDIKELPEKSEEKAEGEPEEKVLPVVNI